MRLEAMAATISGPQNQDKPEQAEPTQGVFSQDDGKGVSREQLSELEIGTAWSGLVSLLLLFSRKIEQRHQRGVANAPNSGGSKPLFEGVSFVRFSSPFSFPRSHAVL